MEAEIRSFVLGRGQLEEVRQSLRSSIARGLERDGEEIKALPAYLSPPSSTASGQALVVDTGGTNMRAAIVQIESRGKSRVVAGPVRAKLEPRGLDGERFFALQAELAAELSPPPGLPVGYCFSYPSASTPTGDGRLLGWTKGIEIAGVEGTLVGERLRAALEARGLAPGPVRVLNDTVASLLAGGAAQVDFPPERFVGLIVGTGTNMAGYFPPSRAPKLRSLIRGPSAVNLESGAFTPPFLTRWDDALDRTTDNPGQHRFEKAISGRYLPYLFRTVLPQLPGFDPEDGAKALVDYRDKSLDSEPLEVAEALLSRSADLVAAGLAALLDHYEPGASAGIVAEGSLFWGDPKYVTRVSSTLDTLLGSERRAKILRIEESNLIGCACAALLEPAGG